MNDIALARVHRAKFVASTEVADKPEAAQACMRSFEASIQKTNMVFSGVIDPDILSSAAKADWREKWDGYLDKPDRTIDEDEVAKMYVAVEVDVACLGFLLDQEIPDRDRHALEVALQGLQTTIPRELREVYG